MRKFCYIFIFIFLNIHLGFGQIWPGDVNNNGVVNNIDLLYIGNAYGKTGPKRNNPNTDWQAQNIDAEWDEFFVGNINLAYADCNGDGIINFADFIVLYAHYNKTHDTTSQDFFLAGTPEFDPQLLLNIQDSIDVIEGGQLIIPIDLGNDSMQIDNFNGIAFSLYYDPDLIKGASISFNLDSSWINIDENIFSVVQNDSEMGVADVTVSRYGNNPVSGSGTIGALSIIIEDNVIPFNSNTKEGTIAIDSIRMVDENLNTTAIANDALLYVIKKDTTTNIYNPLLNQQIFITPNPANEFISIQSNLKIWKIEIYNTLGKLIIQNDFNQINNNQILAKPLNDGIHILKFYTIEGVISKKVLIQH